MAVCSEIHTKQINTVCGLNVELLNVKPAVSNVCYHSLHNLLSSSLLLENIKIKKFITIILHVILYGCETWSLTLREERRLRVFENGMLRRIFGPKRDEVTGNGGNYVMRSFMICTAYPILLWWSNREE